MTLVQQCLAIQTADPRSVCWAGGNLEGEVTLILTDPTLVRGIRLSYRVEAHVDFLDDSPELEVEERDDDDDGDEAGSGRRGRRKHGRRRLWHGAGTGTPRRRTATEKFLDTTSILWGTEPTASYGEMMPAGQHSLAFDIQVPQHLPGSFEGRYGFVRHWLECVVDRPGAPDLSSKRALSVISLCDLNKDPANLKALRHREEVILCCGCIRPDHYDVSYQLPYRGYVPGETMFPEFQLRNFTRNPIYVHVRLQMVTTYRARTKRKITTRVVTEQKKIVHRTEVTKWEPSLQVPALPPTGLGGCNIIDVRFLFEVELTSCGFGWQGLAFQDEVKIGTVPLQDVARAQRPLLTPSYPSPKMAVLLGPAYTSSSQANRTSSTSTGDGRLASDADSATALARLRTKRSPSLISSASHWSFHPGPSFLRHVHGDIRWKTNEPQQRQQAKSQERERAKQKSKLGKKQPINLDAAKSSQQPLPSVYRC